MHVFWFFSGKYAGSYSSQQNMKQEKTECDTMSGSSGAAERIPYEDEDVEKYECTKKNTADSRYR